MLPARITAAEQQCCVFFDFTLRLTDGNLHLEVRAPAEAAPSLSDVFGGALNFRGGVEWRRARSTPW